jgi:prophage antirepressor-like protein
MNGREDDLPCVQFFYREGRQLRAVELSGEIWFSAADIMGHLGHDTGGDRAVTLLTAMGMECRAVPCADGAEKLLLWCIAESDLTHMFDKMEHFAAKEHRTA